MTRKKKIIIAILLLLLCWLIIFCVKVVFFRPTLPKNTQVEMFEREQIDTDFYKCGNSWLLKNEDGLWEMYIEGDPLVRGSVSGALSKDLIMYQEEVFVDQIHAMIPSKALIHFLKFFIGIYNRNLGDYVNEEYKEEIYAISRYASSEFDYIGTPYQRMLNYHGAHDIGHAVQVMGFVGCSALGVWDSHTTDSLLLLGRNFDFYVGDDFAKNKMIVFINPTSGYKHAFVSWGGMMGVVSGMNEQGLAIILNAAPTDIPLSSATPVSIVAREILQYARTIDEAVAIANKRKTFVSEQFIIASAADRKAVSIEKKPDQLSVYATNTDYLICTNHFQSPEFYDQQVYDQTASGYRHERMKELLDEQQTFSPHDMVTLLRDAKGKNDADIGLGNEKSVNQLIAHHSIVFQPETRTFWVSTAPFQLGKFVTYQLDSIFAHTGLPDKKGVSEPAMSIDADTAFINNGVQNYTAFRSLLMKKSLQAKDSLILLNPEFYYTYEFVGDMYFERKEYADAIQYYEMALTKEIPALKQRETIEKRLEKCIKKVRE